jgi:hypothetical protein
MREGGFEFLLFKLFLGVLIEINISIFIIVTHIHWHSCIKLVHATHEAMVAPFFANNKISFQ